MKDREKRKALSELQHWLNKPTGLSNITIMPLSSDVRFALARWKEEVANRQFWGRTVVRCLCAATEAILYSMRQLVLHQSFVSTVQLDKKELELLSDAQWPRGIQQNLKETFRLLGKVNGTKIVVDYNSAGFADLQATFRKRNQLMHPKQPFDVEVRDAYIETAHRAASWFESTFANVLQQTHDGLGIEAERLRASLNKK